MRLLNRPRHSFFFRHFSLSNISRPLAACGVRKKNLKLCVSFWVCLSNTRLVHTKLFRLPCLWCQSFPPVHDSATPAFKAICAFSCIIPQYLMFTEGFGNLSLASWFHMKGGIFLKTVSKVKQPRRMCWKMQHEYFALIFFSCLTSVFSLFALLTSRVKDDEPVGPM